MLRFRRMRSLQKKLAAVPASFYNHFKQERSYYSRANIAQNRAASLVEWRALGTA